MRYIDIETQNYRKIITYLIIILLILFAVHMVLNYRINYFKEKCSESYMKQYKIDNETFKCPCVSEINKENQKNQKNYKKLRINEDFSNIEINLSD